MNAAPMVARVVATRGAAEGVSWQRDEESAAHRLAVGSHLTGGAIVSTTTESRATLILRTGVELRADLSTRIRLAAQDEVELLAGSIYVDTHDARGTSGKGSIAVRTAAGIVTDIGTRFEARASTGRVRVRVRDGVVSFGRGTSQHVSAAGHEILADANGKIAKQRIERFGDEWNWITLAGPEFDLEGRSLKTFLAWIERESGLVASFPDEGVRASVIDSTLHGSITGLTPQEALQVVLPACGLAHRLDKGRVVIVRAGTEASR